MKIERIHIDRFGKLKDFDLTPGEGLTVLYGPNESGKSTLLAFLRAMLYGLNGRSSAVEQNDRRHYMPWGEISMGGSLRLSDGRRRYDIVRVFGQTRKADTCRVTDADTGEAVSVPAGEEPGQTLLGIDEKVFSDTLFVSGAGSRPEGDGALLSDRIRNLIGTGEQSVDLGRVLERLQSAKNELQPRSREKGEIARIRAQLDEARKEWMENGKKEERLVEIRRESEALGGEKSGQNLLKNMRERERILRLLGEYRGQESALKERMREIREEISREEEAEKAEHGKRKGDVLCVFFVLLAALSALLSVLGGLFLGNAFYAGLLVTMGWSILYMRRKDKVESRLSSSDGASRRTEEQMRNLSAAKREQAMYRGQIARLEEQLKATEPEQNEQEETEGEKLIALRVEAETLRKKMKSKTELRAAIEELEKKEKALLRRVRALEMAQEELSAAARDRQRGYLPEVTANMEKILCRATAGKYVRAAVSRSMEVSLEMESGVLQPWAYFSVGTVEVMYLALRLSLTALLERRTGPLPMLLDDPFLLLDDERAQACMEILQESAEDRQILLLTCHRREKEMAAGAQIVKMGAEKE